MADFGEDASEAQLRGWTITALRRETAAPTFQVGTIQAAAPQGATSQVCFSREELRDILNLYGRRVATGEWRDYAIDFTRERAVFSVFRRAAEAPFYRIEKEPKLAMRQGAFSVSNAAGLILKRGHELARVLRVLDKDRFQVLSG